MHGAGHRTSNTVYSLTLFPIVLREDATPGTQLIRGVSQRKKTKAREQRVRTLRPASEIPIRRAIVAANLAS
jgi:hypothetical protein